MQRDSEGRTPPRARSFAFPRELRLKQGTRIREILDRGQRAAGERVLVAVLPNELPHARLACVVGRRYDKRAVVRNRWRRRIKEIFRLRRAELEGADPGWDWVAVALKREGTLAFEQAAKDFLSTAARAKRGRKGGGAKSPSRATSRGETSP